MSDTGFGRRGMRALALAACAVASMGTQCEILLPSVVITAPLDGSFTSDSIVTVSGVVLNADDSLISAVTVNGLPVQLDEQFQFSIDVAIDTDTVFTPLVAELALVSGPPWRDRVTVGFGEAIADGDLSPMGLALRLNDSGLDDLESVVTDLVDLELATLLPVGTLLLDDCVVPGPFGLCLGDARATVDTPAPDISSFTIGLDSAVSAVDGLVSIFDLEINLDIDGGGLVPDCGLRLRATTTTIDGDYALQPDADLPSSIDVNQVGNVSVGFAGFDQEFTSGLCDVPLIGDIIELIIGDLEPEVLTALADFLDDPDGSGPTDSVIADAVEIALAGIEITGPIGTAIGVNLEAPLFDVFEDNDGITLDSDARITASMPDPAAVDLLESYHVPEAFPAFGPSSPGGLPYDLALCISTSSFNQLLKAEIESGLLRTALTEIDLGTGLLPINAALLAVFLPELGALDPAMPLVIEIEPLLAPVLTGAPGPLGELAELRLPALRMSLIDTEGVVRYLDMVVDAKVGLEIEWDALNDALNFTIGTLQASDIEVDVLSNLIATDELFLIALMQTLVPVAFPSLATALESFPIPDLLGLELGIVEIARNGEFLSVFLNTSVPASAH